jgi:1-acyl-sn-glycerol-3-phosphate acyltransferase
MIEFVKAVDTILQRGDLILIYPEQSLWWNYRKPKPLKNGAFRLAARNNVPIVPIFITMQDSKIIGNDGFPIQEYFVNIKEPLYPNKYFSERENMNNLKEKNFEIWKNIYEDFYKIPLEYTTKPNKGTSKNE